MSLLRAKLIRLAYNQPSLQPELLPLLTGRSKQAGLQESVRQYATNIVPKGAKVSSDGKTITLACTLDLPLTILADLPPPVKSSVMPALAKLPIPALMNVVESGALPFSMLPVPVLKKLPAAKLEKEGISDDTLREILEGFEAANDSAVQQFLEKNLVVGLAAEAKMHEMGTKIAKGQVTVEVDYESAKVKVEGGVLNVAAYQAWLFFDDGSFLPSAPQNADEGTVVFLQSAWKKIKPLVEKGGGFRKEWEDKTEVRLHFEDGNALSDVIKIPFDYANVAVNLKVGIPLTKLDRRGLLELLKAFQK